MCHFLPLSLGSALHSSPPQTHSSSPLLPPLPGCVRHAWVVTGGSSAAALLPFFLPEQVPVTNEIMYHVFVHLERDFTQGHKTKGGWLIFSWWLAMAPRARILSPGRRPRSGPPLASAPGFPKAAAAAAAAASCSELGRQLARELDLRAGRRAGGFRGRATAEGFAAWGQATALQHEHTPFPTLFRALAAPTSAAACWLHALHCSPRPAPLRPPRALLTVAGFTFWPMRRMLVLSPTRPAFTFSGYTPSCSGGGGGGSGGEGRERVHPVTQTCSSAPPIPATDPSHHLGPLGLRRGLRWARPPCPAPSEELLH